MRLTQAHVADLIGVCRRELSSWETGRVSPHNRQMPKIYEFLGHIPTNDPADASIGERIRNARRHLGLSRTAAAEQLGVSGVTISLWENGRVAPSKTSRKRIDALLHSYSGIGAV